MSEITATPRWVKAPAEVRNYTMDFANDLDAGETISSVDSVTALRQKGAGSIVIGAPALNGAQVQVSVSGGTDGDEYLLLFKVNTSTGELKQNNGPLRINVE